MTIVSLDLMLRAGRFVGSPHGKSRLGEFARICRRRRSCDFFRNRPYGRPILLCPKGNEGMSEQGPYSFADKTLTIDLHNQTAHLPRNDKYWPSQDALSRHH